jgi:2'-5' RNA ligase
VTVLSPFLDPGRLDRAVFARLAGIAAAEPAFEVVFMAVRRWSPSEQGPGVVWLQPDPAAPFERLTRAVWAAFPEYPPYGRDDGDLEPHLTIAIDDPARHDTVEVEAGAFVPLIRRAGAIDLLVEGRDGRYRRRRRFPLG